MDEQTRTLADRKRGRSNEYLTLTAMDGVNLGRKTLTTRMSIKKFIDWSLVANKDIREHEDHGDEFIAQRSLSAEHARGLAKYVLGGLVRSAILDMNGKSVPEDVLRIKNDLAAGPYAALQPLVCNLRHVDEEDLHIDDKDLPPDVLRLSLGSTQKLWVVDGQHRRDAFDRVIAYLDQILKNGKYPGGKALYAPASTGRDGRLTPDELEFWEAVRNVALNECSVSIEIHIGLNEPEEQQLFSDLNSRSKPLQSSLVQNYDQSDAIAAVSRDKEIIRFHIADESDAKHWNSTGLPLKDIIMINRLLVHGSNAKEATPQSQVDAKLDFIKRFWEVVQRIEGFGDESQRTKTVAGQPVMLKALAKLAYDHAYGVPKLVDEAGLWKLYEAILSKKISFSHSEKLWRALFLNDEERAKEFGQNEQGININDYVHLTAQTKPGEFDALNGWVRYSTAHNDIYPRLGDLIRWKLGLKNRGAAEKSREKERLEIESSRAAAA
ncbi:DNA-sulfur modification-associated [Bradyrhizobium sp. Ghvi]|uniref:DNA sulfur modification protein DndB n=1 Tax=Bradyrhizobium sp. Ghvi TaxID=1855319 RepID=UPI0008EF81A1|nr:DNA sulfur modification protein DndB [Bradyrhizobium sp. Ghvi]SFO03829.1 DNA-sulfur modification-associated [Bradyrhizobium sp. Ghvi]